ncbi:hypothetical protein F8S09_14725 [Deinococcus sp. SDU3-2]|uniref:Uncharacterized protein n=1 Tax=Deinococcus terrestris TaxID=2651870 RepID=A0A7X1TSK8_9DEIO|nr:hypothetical protein [Deinococcus terrestris]MPY67915.1 hypothetical protein [Deinococcus terrestris]
MTAPPAPTSIPSASLTVEALAVADAYRQRTSRQNLPAREKDFHQCVEYLSSVPGFTLARAEAGAEFLKAELAQQQTLWVRFGTNGGNYIAVALPFLTLAALSNAQVLTTITAIISTILLGMVFVLGARFDVVQDTYRIAESLLKSAAKYPKKHDQEKGQDDDPNARIVVAKTQDVLATLKRAQTMMIRTVIIGLASAAVAVLIIRVMSG